MHVEKVQILKHNLKKFSGSYSFKAAAKTSTIFHYRKKVRGPIC